MDGNHERQKQVDSLLASCLEHEASRVVGSSFTGITLAIWKCLKGYRYIFFDSYYQTWMGRVVAMVRLTRRVNWITQPRYLFQARHDINGKSQRYSHPSSPCAYRYLLKHAKFLS